MGFQILFSPSMLLPVFLYICYVLYQHLKRPTDALDVLPWVGLPRGRLAKFRARYSPASGRDTIKQAFHEYNQKGLSFVYQTFLGRPFIVLPASHAQWIIDQPDDVLNFKDATVEQLSLDETSLSPLIARNPIHHDVIKGNLTRALGFTSSLVMDELGESFATFWGEDTTQWVDRNLWESLTSIFAQTSGRVFIGTPMCRNQKFLHNVIQYAELVVSTGSKIRGLPEVLKPVFTHFLLKPNKHYFEKIFVDLGPVVEERKRAFSQAGSSVADEKQESVDLLQWLIVRAFQTGLPEEIDTVMISKRFALVCFAAIHTTSLTSMNLLLDIVSAAPNFNTVANLREEVLKTQRQNNGKWDKASLAKLVQMDSTIRESQRLHSVGSWALHRKVSAKGGVRMPNGLLAPEGSHIAVSAYNIQRDAGNHKDPDTFDPFRFSRSREGLLQLSQNESAGRNANVSARVRASQILKDRNHSAVTTGITHLAFGHGRHACPGRFFAIQEVKLMLVHVLLNYDMKPLEERPENPWLRDVMTPDTKLNISVRKIKQLEV